MMTATQIAGDMLEGQAKVLHLHCLERQAVTGEEPWPHAARAHLWFALATQYNELDRCAAMLAKFYGYAANDEAAPPTAA